MFTENELLLLKKNKIVPEGATAAEVGYFFEVCKRKRLDPFLKQIQMIERSERDGNDGWKKSYTIQASLDGMRAIAQRNCKITSYRRHVKRDGNEVYGCCEISTADRGTYYDEVPYSEYVQKKKDGTITKFWKQFPTTMIKKVAEESVLRMLAPEDLSGVYGDEEMQQSDNGQVYIAGDDAIKMIEPTPEQKAEVAKAVDRVEKTTGTPKLAADVQAVMDAAKVDVSVMLKDIDTIEMFGSVEELDEWQSKNLTAIKALSKSDFAKVVEAGKSARKNLTAKKGVAA